MCMYRVLHDKFDFFSVFSKNFHKRATTQFWPYSCANVFRTNRVNRVNRVTVKLRTGSFKISKGKSIIDIIMG